MVAMMQMQMQNRARKIEMALGMDGESFPACQLYNAPLYASVTGSRRL